ncbi:MAG: hypothetical protein PHU23_07580, partial [Dehalococcoidales bacterium]|nr:hypothetical protein [Dehalococcoidales bacterium]
DALPICSLLGFFFLSLLFSLLFLYFFFEFPKGIPSERSSAHLYSLHFTSISDTHSHPDAFIIVVFQKDIALQGGTTLMTFQA